MPAPNPPGFLRPTTTPTPDDLFDIWLPELTGAELKILLYIIRRTFGFKKDSDAISLAQICGGITTRDGRVLDRGTGVCRTTAYKALQKLEGRGLIHVERRQTIQGDSATNVYRLRFRGFEGGSEGVDESDDGGSPKMHLPVDEKDTHGGCEIHLPVGEKYTPQQTESQETEIQQTGEQSPPPARADDAEVVEAVEVAAQASSQSR